MAREMADGEGVRWSCERAYAGLAGNGAANEAARAEGSDRYRVICTPGGAVRSIAIEPPADREAQLSDQELLRWSERESRSRP